MIFGVAISAAARHADKAIVYHGDLRSFLVDSKTEASCELNEDYRPGAHEFSIFLLCLITQTVGLIRQIVHLIRQQVGLLRLLGKSARLLSKWRVDELNMAGR